MTFLDPAAFLSRCSESSQMTYELLKELIDGATSHDEISKIRRFLTALYSHVDSLDLNSEEFVQRYHFNFTTLTLDGQSHTDNNLRLIQLPSIFSPEEWSFTFFEGLARYPISDFQGRTIAELGCGNGWISIAIARQNCPQRLFGLDINPKAITCARLNLILNAFDDSGTPIFDAEGKTLLERVEFHVSDLLGYIIENRIQLDRVIGCIPQVLSPEPLLASHFIREDADDDFLYSLSNYCEKQGYVEDQFGLGLIARAVEESIEVCKPSAKIILNMGGRPGVSVLDRLFTRRGFSIRRLWSTKVWQASDTDISPLVEIEKSTPHRFEFFTSLNSDEPICAQTAQAYAQSGGRIAHSLIVYEAQLKQSAQLKSLFKLISQPGFEESRSGLDLHFANDELAEEKINFIGNIAEWLQQKPNLPYSDTEGEPLLRRQIAQFLRSYWRIPLTAKSVFISPNRRSIIKNYLQIFQPKLALIDKELHSLILNQTLKNNERNQAPQNTILEAPQRVDEICKLIEKLKPQLVITSLKEFEIKTSDAFVRLCDVCKTNSTQLIIDLSQHFDLSSQPENHGILAHISDHPLPHHVSLLVGLVRNKVYADLELGFLLSENATLLDHLSAAAEFTYSRAPLLTQKYYSRIFSDLLNFQLTSMRSSKAEDLRMPKTVPESSALTIPSSVKSAFSHPSSQTQHLEITRETVRLDYGENSLACPPQVHSSLIESFLRQNISNSDINVEQSICDFAMHRLGLSLNPMTQVVLGNGIAPLFAAMLEFISEEGKKIVIPQGAYGYFTAACDFFNTEYVTAKTHQRDRFKLTAQELDSTLSICGAHWLYLNAPIVNPTGAVYTSGELSDIFDVLNQHKCGLILDTIFSGLEFNKKQTQIKLRNQISTDSTSRVPIVVLGGISKELAAGGLRLGWALSTELALTQSLRQRQSSIPHPTIRYAARKMYQALNTPTHAIHDFLNSQRQLLKDRCDRLTEALAATGWDVLNSEGGLFISASPRKYLDIMQQKHSKHETWNITKAADEIAYKLFTSTGLLVNNATWTGLPCYLRFVVSVEESDFEKALIKLREFDAAWN